MDAQIPDCLKFSSEVVVGGVLGTRLIRQYGTLTFHIQTAIFMPLKLAYTSDVSISGRNFGSGRMLRSTIIQNNLRRPKRKTVTFHCNPKQPSRIERNNGSARVLRSTITQSNLRKQKRKSVTFYHNPKELTETETQERYVLS